jgi:hypothetical protein
VRRTLTLAAAVLLAWPADAAAQQCHSLNGSSWRNPGLLAGVRFDAAGYRNNSFEGNFEGVAPLLSFNHPRITALAMLPAYRLDRNGRAGYGLGDLTLALRTPVRAWSTGRTSVGFGVAATVPTGSAAAGLGMGHVMLMPEFWWVHERGRVQLFGSVGFGRALAGKAAASHHGGGPAPIVNPMNMAEIEASIGAYVQLHRIVWLKMNAFGAMPVGNANTEGRTRVVVAQGVAVNVRGVELSAELQAPLTGAPFLARGVLQVGYRFELKGRKRRHHHH